MLTMMGIILREQTVKTDIKWFSLDKYQNGLYMLMLKVWDKDKARKSISRAFEK